MYEHDENEVLRDALKGLNEEVPPMPEGLHAAWMQKVEDNMNETRTNKTPAMNRITRWLSVAAAMAFIVGGTLLTRDELAPSAAMNTSSQKTVAFSAARSTADYAVEDSAEYEYGADNGVMLTMARGAETSAAPVLAEKKIIRTASMTIATQTFEDSLNALKDACTGQGGWLESSSENVNNYSGLRTAYLTLRIPQDQLDAYLAGTEGLGRITSRSESAQDVTESYQDTAARLETQKALMSRLQALITESGDLSDLLALESQIADTQYMIDSLQASLNSTDRQVTYSTVSITLKEERTVDLTDTNVSMGERLLSAIRTGWESLVSFAGDALVFLVAASPFIAIVVIVVIVVKLITRRKK